MKRIKHKRIEQEMVFDRSSYIHLVIENPRFFRDFVAGVQKQVYEKDEFLSYTDNGKEGDLSKDGLIIFSPFEDINDEKKDSLVIQKYVSATMSDDQKSRFNDIINSIQEFVNEITNDYPLPLEIDNDITAKDFFKSLSLKAYNEDESFFPRMVFALREASVVQKKSIFVLISATDYLEEEEIEGIFHELTSLDSDLWLISGHVTKEKGKNERRIVVDYDLCEL